MDLIFHVLNEFDPIPLQFIHNGMDIAFYLFRKYDTPTMFFPSPRVMSSVTEITGLLTELYLLMTTCLPASSSLLQRDAKKGISPAHKILIEVLFFQLFTFPLLSWAEIKPLVTSLLRSAIASRD